MSIDKQTHTHTCMLMLNHMHAHKCLHSYILFQYFPSSDAATLVFPGYRYMMVVADRQADIEADDITIRFRTLEPNGLLLAMRDDYSNERKKDSLEIVINSGELVLHINMDGHESVVHIGAGLDDKNGTPCTLPVRGGSWSSRLMIGVRRHKLC